MLGERRGSRSAGQRAAGGPAGAWRADDPWDDIWENQGNANPLTVGTFLSAVSHALDASPSLGELPFVIELYENTGARRQLTITGISLTGAGPEPDAVTMTAVPTDVKEDS